MPVLGDRGRPSVPQPFLRAVLGEGRHGRGSDGPAGLGHAFQAGGIDEERQSASRLAT